MIESRGDTFQLSHHFSTEPWLWEKKSGIPGICDVDNLFGDITEHDHHLHQQPTTARLHQQRFLLDWNPMNKHIPKWITASVTLKKSSPNYGHIFKNTISDHHMIYMAHILVYVPGTQMGPLVLIGILALFGGSFPFKHRETLASIHKYIIVS